MFIIAAIFSGFASMPLDIPSNQVVSLFNVEYALFRVELEATLRQVLESFLKVLNVCVFLVALRDEVVDVSDQIFPCLLIEYLVYHPREGKAYIA